MRTWSKDHERDFEEIEANCKEEYQETDEILHGEKGVEGIE